MKTDKELAVELTIAFIDANRKISFNGNGSLSGGISPAITGKDAATVLRSFYKVVSSLEKSQDSLEDIQE